jgi:Flp pilus assembly pilin Flp
MQRMLAAVGRLVVRDEGQDLLEYGMLTVLIAVIAVAAITLLGRQLSAVMWGTIVNNF